MGRGVVRPWRLTVTVTQASCLSISPAPRCPLSSAPWLPDDNSSAFDQAARLSLYRQPRHWDCQDNEHKAMQQYSSSVSQARHIVRRESESQYDPVAPLSIVDQFCFVKGTGQHLSQFWFLTVLDCCAIVQERKEINYQSRHIFVAKLLSNMVSLLHH